MSQEKNKYQFYADHPQTDKQEIKLVKALFDELSKTVSSQKIQRVLSPTKETPENQIQKIGAHKQIELLGILNVLKDLKGRYHYLELRQVLTMYHASKKSTTAFKKLLSKYIGQIEKKLNFLENILIKAHSSKQEIRNELAIFDQQQKILDGQREGHECLTEFFENHLNDVIAETDEGTAMHIPFQSFEEGLNNVYKNTMISLDRYSEERKMPASTKDIYKNMLSEDFTKFQAKSYKTFYSFMQGDHAKRMEILSEAKIELARVLEAGGTNYEQSGEVGLQLSDLDEQISALFLAKGYTPFKATELSILSFLDKRHAGDRYMQHVIKESKKPHSPFEKDLAEAARLSRLSWGKEVLRKVKAAERPAVFSEEQTQAAIAASLQMAKPKKIDLPETEPLKDAKGAKDDSDSEEDSFLFIEKEDVTPPSPTTELAQTMSFYASFHQAIFGQAETGQDRSDTIKSAGGPTPVLTTPESILGAGGGMFGSAPAQESTVAVSAQPSVDDAAPGHTA